jgi:hypothetical protein
LKGDEMFRSWYVRKSICLLLALCIFNLSLTGCGGHEANPVVRYVPGEENMSCAGLLSEITKIDSELVTKEKKKKDRNFWNVILIAGGILVIVPFFFIDAKGSYEAEIDALKARKKILKAFFSEKDCFEDLSADPNSL